MVDVGSSETGPTDLIGGPFAVIESDPAVFTTLIRKLGIHGLEVTEIYDIEPWATDYLNPRGLIFCYPCEVDDDGTETTSESQYNRTLCDPDSEHVWYAHQLSSDACASQAVLNVVLNLSDVEMENDLKFFLSDTTGMDPVMKGLAVTNCQWIREAHNSLARPADIRGAQHSVAKSTLEYAKKQRAAARKEASGPPAKRRKTVLVSPRKEKEAQTDNMQESYHFIGYVPRDGRVWELDSLRPGGPLEVGDFSSNELTAGAPPHKGWMDIVRPAIKRRMHHLMASGSENISFNLLAIVDDRYEKASDELEMLKRERIQLERRLNEAFPDGWSEKVQADLYASRSSIFETSAQSQKPGPTFARNFASRKLTQDMSVLDMPQRNLVPAWETCLRAAMSAKVAVEEELANAARAHTEHINRTFDYEPFIHTFISQMHNEGLLDPMLSVAGKGTATEEPKATRPQKLRAG
ncbi:hypothetical protein BC835DRAFT_1416146 [Cytidiella melzeri]|nr:hypothetical protein BC835DRAFT_1416146 [Cytidiella melzeri]